MQNERACTFISGKVCILGSIKVRIQTLPEINVHARLFGTLEYLQQKKTVISKTSSQHARGQKLMNFTTKKAFFFYRDDTWVVRPC